jgi:hypothetical protein
MDGRTLLPTSFSHCRGIVGNVQNQIIQFDDYACKKLGLMPNYFYWAHGPLLQIFERRCAASAAWEACSGEPNEAQKALIESAQNQVSETIILNHSAFFGWQIPKTVMFDGSHRFINYVRLLLWREHWWGVVESRRRRGDLTPPLDQLHAEVETLAAKYGPIKVADVKDVATGGLRYKSEVLSFDELRVLWEYTAMSHPIDLDLEDEAAE